VSPDGVRTPRRGDPSGDPEPTRTEHDADGASPDVADGAGSQGPARPARRGVSPLRLLVLLTVAALVVAAVRVLLVQAFVVPSASMSPLLKVGDRVLVSRLDYRIGDVRRGDVIVFDGEGVFDAPTTPARSPLAAAGRAVAGALGAPIGEDDYVKRVIGLPGERITCCDAAGRLGVNGRPLPEPYLPARTPASAFRFDIVVPPGRLWVMGDNRNDSADSRAHLGDPGGGTVPMDHVVGRVITIWWPWGRATGIGRSAEPFPSR
jgi:signal peptidase I